ncbi:MAG TPA: hypothetical protein PLX23_01330 [Candidatus Hydrogenedens sp.]|mgnify:CR=1 FL=1|nr:hypothetical protein [Candidatus Hydrogenedens sp.]
MKRRFIYRFIILCAVLLISIPTYSQYYNNSQRRGSVSFGGKRLVNNDFTVGGINANRIQPRYGGQIVDERDLYNPYLEEAFRYMGKPLVLHHPSPFWGNRGTNTDEKIFLPQTLPSYRTPVNNSTTSYSKMRVPNNSASKESERLTPIIPTVVGTVDAMFRNSKREESDTISDTKRVSLDGWYGDIRKTGSNSGNFYVRNTNGEYVSGSFYKTRNHIDYNITHNGKEGSNTWRADNYQQNSGGSLYLRSDQNSISGSTTTYGDTYRYRFNDRDNNYEVELRNMGKSSQSIRINENNNNYIYGYAD